MLDVSLQFVYDENVLFAAVDVYQL